MCVAVCCHTGAESVLLHVARTRQQTSKTINTLVRSDSRRASPSADGYKDYLLLDPQTDRTFVSRDVRFMENEFKAMAVPPTRHGHQPQSQSREMIPPVRRSSNTGHIYTFPRNGGVQSSTPVPYDFPTSVSSLAVTKLITASLALLEDGTVHSLIPVKQHSALLRDALAAWNSSVDRRRHTVTDVVLGSDQSVGVILTAEGKLFSFGLNEHGERGVGHTRDHRSMPLVTLVTKFQPTDSPAPLPDAAISALNVRIVSVSVGTAHMLALSDTGDVYGWGRNIEGQLSIDPASGAAIVPSPVFLQSHRRQAVRQVKCCQNYSLTLDEHDQLWYSGYGLVPHSMPHQPLLLPYDSSAGVEPEPILTFDVGHSHLIAITVTNTVLSIGTGLFGQLGLGNSAIKSYALTAVRMPDSLTAPVVEVVCGAQTTFLIDDQGGVYACGSNQHGKLTATLDSPHLHQPMPLVVLAGLTVSSIGISDDSTSYFVSTRITSINPSFLSHHGDTELTLSGVGFFAHSAPMTVKFTSNGQCAIVEAVYDVLRDRIRCVSPPLSIDIASSRTPCQVSVSLDGAHYSDSVPAHVYAPPPADETSLKPQCVPMSGAQQCVLSVPLLSLPYHSLTVRLRSDESNWQRDVSAEYDHDRQSLTFSSPTILDADAPSSSYVDATLSLSFNQQQFYPLSQTLSFYRLSHCESEVSCVSLIPSAYHLNVQGCHHHQRLTVKFVASDRDFTATVRATFTSARALWLLRREKREQAYQKLLAERANNDAIRTKLAKPEEEKDEDDRKREEDEKKLRDHQFASEDADYTNTMARMASEDQLVSELSEREQAGHGCISCMSPSLVTLGPCHLAVFVSLNDRDYQDTGLVVCVEAPTLGALWPDCGPVTGDTAVRVTGQGFFPCQAVTAQLTTLSLAVLPAADSAGPADDKSSAKGGAKKGSASANSRSSLTASPRPGSTSARRVAGASPLLTPSDVTLSPPLATPPNSVVVTQSAAYTGAGCVQYTTAAHSAGEEQVSLAFQFDAQAPPVLSSPSQTFVYYQQPAFSEACPSIASVYGNTDVALVGKGLFPSAHVAVKLTLRELDEDRKSKEKEAKTARKDKTKLTDEEKSKLENEEKARDREDAERRANAPFVVVKALIKGMDEDEELLSAAKSPKASTAAKKKSKDEVVQASVNFTVPHAALLGASFSADIDLEPNFVDSIIGRSLEVSVAMNGQQFVGTGLIIKYEQSLKSKKTTKKK